MNLQDAVKFYEQNVEQSRLDVFGGYPSIINTESIPGWVVIASVIDATNEPSFDVWTVENFINAMEEWKARQ